MSILRKLFGLPPKASADTPKKPGDAGYFYAQTARPAPAPVRRSFPPPAHPSVHSRRVEDRRNDTSGGGSDLNVSLNFGSWSSPASAPPAAAPVSEGFKSGGGGEYQGGGSSGDYGSSGGDSGGGGGGDGGGGGGEIRYVSTATTFIKNRAARRIQRRTGFDRA